jgi:hypothetical protein
MRDIALIAVACKATVPSSSAPPLKPQPCRGQGRRGEPPPTPEASRPELAALVARIGPDRVLNCLDPVTRPAPSLAAE